MYETFQGNSEVEKIKYDVLLVNEHQRKIALEFRCEDTAPSQRRLCQSFWRMIDEHPKLDRIMAKGWLEREDMEVTLDSQIGTVPRSFCDDLREFKDRRIDRMVYPLTKNHMSTCIKDEDIKTSSSTDEVLHDLEKFNSTVLTEHCAPPKLSRETFSKQEKALKNH